jgi:hypothetical protein
MKSKRLVALLVAALSLVGPVRALAWNAVSHAWIARELHWQAGVLAPTNPNLLYGSTAPDMFQAHFTPVWAQLQALVHEQDTAALLEVWDAASTRQQRVFAIGMLAHGNGWGADQTAHWRARTTAHDRGYIIAKAQVLAPQLAPLLAASGIILPDDVLLLVCHILVEQAVDLQLVADDPTIAPELFQAASARDASVPDLLVEAWALPFAAIVGDEAAAAAFVVAAEAQFRWDTAAYAWALTQPDALELVAGGIGRQAEEFLGLPPGYGVNLEPLIQYGIGQAVKLTAADYKRELRATAGWVGWELLLHGTTLWRPPTWGDRD